MSLLSPPIEHINERAVCNAIAPEKDVDGFHIVNIGKLCLDQRSMVPATPAAVWEIIKRAGKSQQPLLTLYGDGPASGTAANA